MDKDISNGLPRWDEKTVIDWLLGTTFDYAVILDRKGTVIAANDQLVATIGASDKDIRGTSFFSYFPAEIARKREALLAKVLAERRPLQYEDNFQPPRVYDTRIRPIPNRHGDITHIAVFFSDISSQKKVEEEHVRMATAIEQAVEAIIIFDDRFRIQYVNQAFETMSGYSQSEARGKSIHLLYAGNAQLSKLDEIMQTLGQEEIWSGRTLNTKKNGNVWQVEKTISPIRGHRGIILGYVSVWRDVSVVDKLERQLRQAQKMEAIGTLAGGIAHDFNNILGPIILHAELVKEQVKHDTQIHYSIGQILEAAGRATTLIDQILNLSRRHELDEPLPFQLGTIVKECLKLLRPSISSTIRITHKIEKDGDWILADPSQTHQVIMNLCTNAVQAMEENGGQLSIRVSNIRITEKENHGFNTMPSGRYVRLAVQDTGIGISDKLKDKIFDPFFTTKNGIGTGLGLSVVQGIVTRLKGGIRVRSKPRKGSTFEIVFPFAPSHATSEYNPKAEGNPPSGYEKVLVVDDDPLMLRSIKSSLTRRGYRVTAMESSPKALNHFKRHLDKYQLVISDVSMPDMTGVQLVRRMLRLKPGVPIILMSGFTQVITPSDAAQLGGCKLLTKPFHSDQLARSVRQALESRTPTSAK